MSIKFKDIAQGESIETFSLRIDESDYIVDQSSEFLEESFLGGQEEEEFLKNLTKFDQAYARIMRIINDGRPYTLLQEHLYPELMNVVSFLESFDDGTKDAYELNQEVLDKFKKDLTDALNPSEEIIRERRKEREIVRSIEREKANEVYKQLHVTITPDDVNKYLTPKKFLPKKKILKDDINYPVLMFFYKNGELIDIRKESLSLDKKLRILTKTVDFDEYKVLEVPKDGTNELFYEALIKFRPKNPLKALSLYPAANYKTMNDVKRKYFGKLKLKKIMKIIELHSVPIHSFDNGLIIVHRDLLDKAIQENKYV